MFRGWNKSYTLFANAGLRTPRERMFARLATSGQSSVCERGPENADLYVALCEHASRLQIVLRVENFAAYGWEPSSNSNLSIRVVRAYPLIETRQTAPCRAIRGNSISVNTTLPPSYWRSSRTRRSWIRRTSSWSALWRGSCGEEESAQPRRATKEGQWVLRTPLHIRTLVFLYSAWF